MCDDLLCDSCGHNQSYLELGDGDRCCRLKNIPIIHAWKICDGEYYFNKEQGLSLYALVEWFKTLSDEEKEKPLGVEFENTDLEPVIVLKIAKDNDWKWSIFTKRSDYDERC